MLGLYPQGAAPNGWSGSQSQTVPPPPPPDPAGGIDISKVSLFRVVIFEGTGSRLVVF